MGEVIPFPKGGRWGRQAPEAFITKRELAAYLGVSESWIQRRMKLGLPFHREPVFGRTVRFKRSEVDAWLESRGEQIA